MSSILGKAQLGNLLLGDVQPPTQSPVVSAAIDASWDLGTASFAFQASSTPLSADWQIGDATFVATLSGATLSGDFQLVSQTLAASGAATLSGTALSGDFQLVDQSLAASGAATLSASPLSGDFQLVSQTLASSGIAAAVGDALSGDFQLVAQSLAPSGIAAAIGAFLDASWSAGLPQPIPSQIRTLDATWHLGEARLVARQNYVLTDGFFPGTGGLFDPGAQTGFDPSLGIWWRVSPDDPWQYLGPGAISGFVFTLPITGGAYIRYGSHPILVERGELLHGPWNRLPSWTRPSTDPTAPTRQLLRPFAYQGALIGSRSRMATLSRFLGSAPVGVPRLTWVGPVLNSRPNDLTVAFRSDNGTEGVCRAARSAFDFDTAVDPVWWSEIATRQVLLRNLMVLERELYSSTRDFRISGELSGLVTDFGVYWRTSRSLPWEWLDPESGAVSGTTVTLPITGSVQLRYGSQALLAGLDGELILAWQGGQTRSFALALQTPANLFDSYGALLNLPRLPLEDNLAYKLRLLALAAGRPDTTRPGVLRGIAAPLGLLRSFAWDGVTTLNLDPSGTLAVTHVTVVGIDRIRELSEVLSPDQNSAAAFYATYGSWRPDSLVLVDGRPVQTLSLSGNRLTLALPATGRVTAVYSLEQYVPTYDSSGLIRTLLPGTGIASGSYTVLAVQFVNLYSPDLPQAQSERLLTAAGLPNLLFLDLAGTLQEKNPTAFGRGRWSRAFWPEESETLPPISRLPVPLDVSSLGES